MARIVRTVQFGLGPIGAGLARLAAQKSAVTLVGGIDIDPNKVGRDLGDVIGLGRQLGVPVRSDAAEALPEWRPDVVLHTTGSYLAQVGPQIEQLIEAGTNVVSTCEELAYPVVHAPDWAERLDSLAKAKGVTVLGTGVNPGWVMDTLPIFLTGVCHEVRRVSVQRVVDASKRREPLQRKVGAGLSRGEFQQLVDAGKVRHVGLKESVTMLAESIGWQLDEVTESTEAQVATTLVKTDYLEVQPGQVAGVRQVGRGFRQGEELITLELQMYVGAEGSKDAIQIEGTPPIDAVLMGGTHGDLATAAIAVNAIPRVLDAPAGLVTMRDLPPVAFWR